jgi:hypothetical protein
VKSCDASGAAKKLEFRIEKTLLVGYGGFSTNTQTNKKGQMKHSKAQVEARVHAIPALKFEEQQLSSFAGIVVLQSLFAQLGLKDRLRRCFAHWRRWRAYSPHIIVMVLVLHLMLGFRRLRDLAYYKDDPMVRRCLGLRRLPDVSTISRQLAEMDQKAVDNVRAESRRLVLDRLAAEALPRVTLDFDGSVQSTRSHAEGTAVGFNKKRKGARSYYPLFCTVSQTGQFVDLLHRPGNVHDSNGAAEFMSECIGHVRTALPNAIFEARMDSAFCTEGILNSLHQQGVEFSASVAFERIPKLKELIETCTTWQQIDKVWSVAEFDFMPGRWNTTFRFIAVRQHVPKQRSGPLQLDLFEPREYQYDYKVIITNKTVSAALVLEFHNGRGCQESVIGEAKSCTALDYVPMRRRCANQIFCVASIMAHNLGREMQMAAQPRRDRNAPNRSALWQFRTLRTLARLFIQRAGRLTTPEGRLTLCMSANARVREELTTYMDALKKAA